MVEIHDRVERRTEGTGMCSKDQALTFLSVKGEKINVTFLLDDSVKSHGRGGFGYWNLGAVFVGLNFNDIGELADPEKIW